jgi:Flp pilus assembly protein TadD
MLTIKNRAGYASAAQPAFTRIGLAYFDSFARPSFNLCKFPVLILLSVCCIWFCGCTPPGPQALLDGQKLLMEGKYPQAVEKLRAATSLLTNNANAWNYLGLAYHQAGSLTEADRAYSRALQYDRDLAEVHYNLGCLWLSQGKLDAAKAELTTYTFRRANSLEGHIKLGTAQWRSRDFAAAERSFSDAYRLSPQNADVLNGLGLVRVQRGRASEGAQFFASVVKLHPDYAPALLNLAIVEQQYLRDRPFALQKYREYLALNPAPASAESVKAVVRQLEQELDARPRVAPTNTPAVSGPSAAPPKPLPLNSNPVVHVASAQKPVPTTNSPKPVNVNPPRPVPAVTVVSAPSNMETVHLQAEGPVKPAHDVVTLPLSRPPAPIPQATPQAAPVEPQTNLSSSPVEPGVTTSAKRGFLQGINPLRLFRREDKTAVKPTPLPVDSAVPVEAKKIAPSKPEPATPSSTDAPKVVFARYSYGSSAKPVSGNRPEAETVFARGLEAQKSNRLPEAIQQYRLATQMDPAFFGAYYNLGLAASDTGNFSTALSAYEKALALEPDSVDARYNFALTLRKAEYPVDAANELEKLLAKSPNEARAHLALGNLYAQLFHLPSRARPHYLKVVELEPRNPQAGAIRFWLAANPE